MCEDIPGISNLFHWSMCLFLSNTIPVWLLQCYNIVWNQEMWGLLLCSLVSELLLALCSFMCCHMTIRVVFSFCKKCHMKTSYWNGGNRWYCGNSSCLGCTRDQLDHLYLIHLPVFPLPGQQPGNFSYPWINWVLHMENLGYLFSELIHFWELY